MDIPVSTEMVLRSFGSPFLSVMVTGLPLPPVQRMVVGTPAVTEPGVVVKASTAWAAADDASAATARRVLKSCMFSSLVATECGVN